MKKLALIAAAFGLVAAAHAQAPFGLPIKALGYDATPGWNQISARLPLGDNANLDAGVNIGYNDLAASDKFGFGVSGIYLINLHNWGPVSTHLAAGGNLTKPVAASDLGLTATAGIQPEVLLLDRLLVSTRFGLEVDVIPDLMIRTVGQGVSIVSGASFKIVF